MTLLRSSLFALALLVVTPVYALLAMLAAPLPRRARYRFITGWSIIMLWLLRRLCGVSWTVEGREHLPARPSVILSKHQSAWETLAFQSIFPPQVYVLKRRLLWVPFFGWGLALMSPIAIDRARGTAALRQIARKGKRRLEQGFWVAIFPEGTRVAPGSKRKYHLGAAWLAAHAAVPVVPVAHNAGRAWPRHWLIKHPFHITVRIGPPIETAGRDPAAINAEAETWIEGEQRELDAATA